MSLNDNTETIDSDPNKISPSNTILKYEKSSCLFCNEWFDSQTFTEHLIHCGQVLEQCPNSCNVFVPRIRMRSHLKECPRSKQKMEKNDNNLEHRVVVLEQDNGTLRSVLNEEIRQRLHLITDVGNLRKQNQRNDEWSRDIEEALRKLKLQLDDENSQRSYELDQCQKDFRYCFDISQSLKSDVNHELEGIRDHVNQMSDHQNHLNENIMKLEEVILEQERMNRDKFVECEEFMTSVDIDLKTKYTTNNDLSAKVANLDLEVKSMKNIVCETEERCEKLELLTTDMDRNLHLAIQTLADIENHLATQQRLAGLQNTRGHLIWKIKDFSKKLEESKQYDTILHSSMFSNKPFGYSLRLDIFLNGKGMWKGDHMIACLNVIAGEYDQLLEWPCRLEADIILREQTVNPADAQNYVKRILVKKKSDDLIQANTYFFIPHKIIKNAKYLKGDSIYIEVKVTK